MQRTATIHIFDFVNCSVTGLHPDHTSFLYEELGVYATNYMFQPKYQLGQWSGKIRYFHNSGKTFVNLLDRIIPHLVRWGYKVAVEDNRPDLIASPKQLDKDFFSHILNDDDEPWEIRPYQIDMVNKLTSNGGGIGLAATGSGKTNMTAAIALLYEQSNNYRSIIIVPDKYLNKQTTNDYKFFGLDVGQYYGEIKDLNHQHVVSTWQSLKNVPTLIQEFQVVIVDECFSPDTPILMANGDYKWICNIKIGDKIQSYNQQTKELEVDTVNKVFDNMIKSKGETMYELEFDEGTTIKVTGNHPILTTIGFKRADELTSMDEVLSVC